MFVLFLNPMQCRAEAETPIARAEDAAALEAFLERERVEPYRDDGWYKVFRKGGPLEWYNESAGAFQGEMIRNMGTLEDWLEATRRRWEAMRAAIPEAQ